MDHTRFDTKLNRIHSCSQVKSISLLMGFVKLIMALVIIAAYCFLPVTHPRNINYILILVYSILIECVAVTIFVAGYFGNNIIYLSWYYFMSYLLLAMKVSISSMYIYFSLTVLVGPYATLIVTDMILLFVMRKEIKEHKNKTRSPNEFVNKLTNYNDMFKITIPNQLENVDIHGGKKADNSEQNEKNNPGFAEGGIIATDTFLYM